MKNERGSISLFVLLSALFFLVVVTSVGVSFKNKETRIDTEFAKIKASYEKDIGNEEQIYLEKTNNEENVDFLTDNDYLIVMEASKSKFEGKINVGTIEEFKNLVEHGQFNYKNAYLYENIELNGSETNAWTPIGTSTNKFDKIFDGRNYSINGIYANSSEQGQALFRYNAGTIKNLTVKGQIDCNAIGVAGVVGKNDGTIENCTSNVTIIGNEFVGGVVGYNSTTGLVKNCTSNNYIKGKQLVGGIVGESDGTITDCVNNGKVESTSNEESTVTPGLLGIGGITGATYGNISNSKNSGEIVSVSYNIGGIVGMSHNAQISKCFNDGAIITRGFLFVGGIVGCQDGNTSSINYCYNLNSVEGGHNIGGIVGALRAGSVNNCYNVGQISSYLDLSQHDNGVLCAGGIAGYNTDSAQINNCYSLDSLNIEIVGIPAENTVDSLSKKETEANMKSAEFITTLNSTENNFKKGDGYPILSWQ